MSQSHKAQKMKFSIKNIFSKYNQIRNSKKFLMENFIFCGVTLF